MNYYIDLDNTMYNTPELVKDMLSEIAINICKVTSKDTEEMIAELKAMFNRENIYNIYKLARFFGEKYNIDQEELVCKVEKIILDGNKYVFPDVIDFLKKLKEAGHTINMLTYVAQEDLSYQLSKIKGSGLTNYFDNLNIVSSKKFAIDLKYNEGIFIDDSPKDLRGLAANNPVKLIRMRRDGIKYSKEDLDIEKLIECKTFNDVIL